MFDPKIKSLLKEHALFSVLDDADLDRLAGGIHWVDFPMGETIVKQGEPGDAAYLISSGKVRIVQTDAAGRQVTLGVMHQGDVFGERSILRNELRIATVRASEEVHLLKITRDKFQELIAARPELKQYFDKFIEETSVLNFLKLTTIMGALPPKQIMSMMNRLEDCSFDAGDVVFQQGDEGDSMYIVRSGCFRVVREPPGTPDPSGLRDPVGTGELLKLLREGDYFGELSLINRTPRAATVLAAEPSRCYRLGSAGFDQIVRASPELRERLAQGIQGYRVRTDYTASATLPEAPQLPRELESPPDGESLAGPEPQLRPVRRWFAEFPWIRQLDQTDCAAASIAMVASYFGIKLRVGRLRDRVNVGREGASIYSMSVGAEKLGFVTRIVRTDLKHLKSARLPVIAHWKGYHYIVVYRIEADRITVGDPGVGIVRMPLAEFEEGWTGHLLLLSPTARLVQQAEQESTLARFLPLASSFRLSLFQVFIASAAMAGLGLIGPLIAQTTLDDVLSKGNKSLLSNVIFAGVAVALAMIATASLRRWLLITVSSRLDTTMSTRLLARVLDLPVRYFQTRRLGDVLNRFADNARVREYLTGPCVAILVDLMLMLASLGLMASYNQELAGLTLLLVLATGVITLIHTPTYRRSQQRLFEKSALTHSRLIETLRSASTIKAAGAEVTAGGRYEELLLQQVDAAAKGARLDVWISMVTSTAQAVALALALWWGTGLELAGKITVGQLAACGLLAWMVMIPVKRLVNVWLQTQDALLSLERLRDVYDADPEQPAQLSRQQLPELKGHIQFENVDFSYSEGEDLAVAGINLEILPGQSVAIVGRSGSGKTTLASLVQGFFPPTRGRILIDGMDIQSMSKKGLRAQIGAVSQDPGIFTGPIRENIALSDPAAPIQRIMSAAQLAGAHEFISGLSLAYDTVIGELGVNLSTGQRQRLAIARALLKNPRIVIFDEATSSLDAESERAFHNNLGDILKGRTALIVTHRLSMIQHVDRIIVIDRGTIVESGTYSELIARKGLYAHLYEQGRGEG